MSIYYEMTGSPRTAGFNTKAELIKHLAGHGYIKDDLSGEGYGKVPDKVCDLLLTNSYDSPSNKMKKAKKLGIQILTFQDLLKDTRKNTEMRAIAIKLVVLVNSPLAKDKSDELNELFGGTIGSYYHIVKALVEIARTNIKGKEQDNIIKFLESDDEGMVMMGASMLEGILEE